MLYALKPSIIAYNTKSSLTHWSKKYNISSITYITSQKTESKGLVPQN